MLTKEQLQLLQSFVQLCKAKPAFIHHPDLGFYREWLEGLGATLPDKPPEPEKSATPPSSPKAPEPKTPSPPPEEPEEPESDLELDMEGVIEAESDEPPSMPAGDKEVSEEMEEQSNEKRSAAMTAFSEGNFEESVKLFTEALEINPHSAILHAKRASALLKLNKPKAALLDCDKAISLNPDSAGPYKFRGRANRLLGKFEEAHADLSTACRLDYDDQANEWMKEVEPNAKRILEHKRKQERRQEDKLIREKKERMRKAKEAYEKQKKEDEERMKAGFGEDEDDFQGFPGGMPGGFPGGMPGGFPGGMPGGFPGGMPGGAGGGGGGMPDLSSLFSDPEIMTLMKDPEVQAAFAEVSKNPANAMKYMSNPKMKKIFDKLGGGLGGGGAGFPGAGGPTSDGPTGAGSGGTPTGTTPTSAPDVDVD